MTISPGWYALLFLAAFVAGFIDSIAGGGGLITLPVLLTSGFSVPVALGTNKLQASFGSGSATWHFAKAGLIQWPEVRLGVLVTFLFSMAGARAVQRLSPDLLRQLIPFLLITIAVYTLLQPNLGKSEARQKMAPHLFACLFGVVIGFYDGFFGPGTGSFWAMACVLLLGFNFTKATAYTKAMNFASNVGSLLIFLSAGQVHLTAGLLMGVGQWCGARLGSRLVIHKGARLIRPIFICVVLAITLKLIWSNF